MTDSIDDGLGIRSSVNGLGWQASYFEIMLRVWNRESAKGDSMGMSRCQKGLSASVALVLVSFLVATGAFFSAACVLAQRARERGQFLPADRAPTDTEALLGITMEYVAGSSDNVDVLFFGDSTCRFAIIPQLFEQHTGLSAYNLGTNGFLGIDGYGTMLHTYLRHHPRPRAVVLCISPRLLRGYNKYLLAVIGEQFAAVYGNRRPFNLHWLTWDVKLAVRELRSDDRYLEMPVLGMPGKTTYAQVRAMCFENRGYCPLDPPPPKERESKSPCSVDAKVESDLIEFVRAVGELRLPLLVRFTPIADDETSIVPVDMQSRLSNLGANAVLGQPMILEYPAQCLDDLDHCRRPAAERFTEFVAKEVTKLIPAQAVTWAPTPGPGKSPNMEARN